MNSATAFTEISFLLRKPCVYEPRYRRIVNPGGILPRFGRLALEALYSATSHLFHPLAVLSGDEVEVVVRPGRQTKADYATP